MFADFVQGRTNVEFPDVRAVASRLVLDCRTVARDLGGGLRPDFSSLDNRYARPSRLLAYPITRWFGPVVAYNVLCLLAPASAAWAA